MTKTPPADPTEPSLHVNRELGLLEFNRRVLEQAKDAAAPLLERLRFLTICGTNLDEFFEIRVASHKELASYGIAQRGHDGRSPSETLAAISMTTHDLVREQYEVLNGLLLPALEAEQIRLIKRQDWTARQQRWIRRYFQTQVLPVLTPMGLDPAHPFPRIQNKSLNFIVQVEGEDAYGRRSEIAVVQVPRALPRLINLPTDVSSGTNDFVMLSSVIHAHIDEVVPGMVVKGCYQFRVTRNADLWVDEEEIDDLLKAVQGELPERKYAAAVRLEVTRECPDELASFLLEKFELDESDLYRVDGPVNLNRLLSLYKLVDRPDLKYAPFVPRIPRRLEHAESYFDVLKKGDVLLHHPYESFTPVLEFLRQAAADPDVLAIKQTLYRVGSGSGLVEALIDAARAGKEVTVVIELRARFDEAENIDLARRLQEVGANVVYGIVGYKTHAKMLLVVRRECRGIRRYVHLGSGNYHAGTARAYTDIGFMTARSDFGEDVHRLFVQLTGLGKLRKLKKILQSPFELHRSLLALIEGEARSARDGKPARIVAKMNSLTEPAIIQALYRASQAGVSIDLIVRGPCCLRPGVPGISENVRVRSIVGRFLEHSRVFYFHADGEEMVLCSSADWMSRNMFRRVETCFPVEEPRLKARLVRECLEVSLSDNLQSWSMRSDGSYERVRAASDERHLAAQATLLERLTQDDREREDADGLLLKFVASRGKGQKRGSKPKSARTSARPRGQRRSG